MQEMNKAVEEAKEQETQAQQAKERTEERKGRAAALKALAKNTDERTAADKDLAVAKQILVTAEQEATMAKKTREAAEKILKRYKEGINGKSGANYYSNVSILEAMNLIEDPETEVSVYIEGIGTDDGEEDSSLGFAFGAGPTGVPAKVSKGIAELVEKIKIVLKESEKQLGELEVDTFGFSRGAVAARHFVARTTAQYFPERTTLCNELGLDPAALTVNFVGLFDSVSSYGGERPMPAQVYHNVVKKSFNDDVAELRLNLEGVPAQVIHLTAADEYRKNFASTTIDSSLQVSKGFECALPGVHSDIGGGYEELALEVRKVPESQRQRLLDEGWYMNEPDEQLVSAGWGGWHVGSRLLTHHYQFVSLAIMMDFAVRYNVTFKPFEDEFKAYAVPPDLTGVCDALQAQVKAVYGSQKRELITLPDEYKWVRNKYMHRSALKRVLSTSGLAMKGREKKGLPDRELISDLAG
jgi:hypothetical protein